ncbi:MAG: shikimate kinase [Candidatus Omnitrophica bacterium]|nr:shikimate kinase [Candidatus Omnitrophota bacterium]
MKKNIVLIGFMGAGKSMIAEELSRRLKAQVFSTDAQIEERQGCSIDEIFKIKGEAYFREIEKEVIEELSLRCGVIIDCGGGVVLSEENLQNLKVNGIVFYLEAMPEVIYQRIKSETHRPLLRVPDPFGAIKKLYQQRSPLYSQADHVIDANDASIEGPVVEILKLYKNS